MTDPHMPADIPSPIDLCDPAQARDWANTAMVKRSWRKEFFGAILEEIRGRIVADVSVLELGSGPGFFARRLLTATPAVRYTALDFSPAMHTLAREQLGELAGRVQFIERDFKHPGWSAGLPVFDAVVAVQCVHELRHKRHALALYRAVRELLGSKGIFLMCDHYAGGDGMDDRELYMTPQEHEAALSAAGFSQVRMLLKKGGLILFRAAAGPNG
jgi:SAM-dependent methyltransferase